MKAFTRTYLALAVIAALVGVAECFHWCEHFGTLGSGCLLAFAPVAPFLFAYAFGRIYANWPRRQRITAHVIAVLACSLGIVLGVSIGIHGDEALAIVTPVTTPNRYEEILKTYWGPDRSDLVRHFPRPIPADAKDVRFYSPPMFGQGGLIIQLRYRTTPAIIAELYERFSRTATKSFVGGDSGGYTKGEDGMPTIYFYTSGSENHRFPDDYEVMIFDPILTAKDRPHSWNHGKCHGVAISKKRSEIVYSAEQW